jgi:hypothetical protein
MLDRSGHFCFDQQRCGNRVVEEVPVAAARDSLLFYAYIFFDQANAINC